MIKKQIILLIAIYIATLTSCTSQNNVESSKLKINIGKNILVGTEPKESLLLEPHVAAHPTNPNHLIAVAAVVSTSLESDSNIDHTVIFVSKDGGKTWDRKDMKDQAGLDAWVAFSDKKAVVSVLGKHPIYQEYKFNEGNQLLVYISKDGGDTWSKTPQSLGNFHDGPRSIIGKNGDVIIANDRPPGPVNSVIHVAKVRHDDSAERVSYVNPSNLNISIDGITAFADGTLALSFQDYQFPTTGPRKDKNGKHRGRIKTRREWLITSTDNGKTFSPPKLITERFFDRANDLTVDKTEGKYKDRLYCVGSNRDYQSVLITYSDDKGYTWTDATAIEKEELTGIRIEPHVAVNKDGILAVAWFDSRDNPKSGLYPNSGLCFSPYVTFSSDGGKTFSKPLKVADKKSCLDKKKVGTALVRRFPEGGDYFGFTASADGKFHIVWPDARSGKFEIMTSAITVKK